jgi:hypothetical protein
MHAHHVISQAIDSTNNPVRRCGALNAIGSLVKKYPAALASLGAPPALSGESLTRRPFRRAVAMCGAGCTVLGPI